MLPSTWERKRRIMSISKWYSVYIANKRPFDCNMGSTRRGALSIYPPEIRIKLQYFKCQLSMSHTFVHESRYFAAKYGSHTALRIKKYYTYLSIKLFYGWTNQFKMAFKQSFSAIDPRRLCLTRYINFHVGYTEGSSASNLRRLPWWVPSLNQMMTNSFN